MERFRRETARYTIENWKVVLGWRLRGKKEYIGDGCIVFIALALDKLLRLGRDSHIVLEIILWPV